MRPHQLCRQRDTPVLCKTKMKTITVLLFLLVAASIHAQLAVTVAPPQVTGDKAIVPLELKNNFNQTVASARAAVLLLDEQGKMVGQSSKWVIGGAAQPGSASQSGLAAGSTNTFNFVITATKPLTSTNLTAKVVFNRILLEDGKSADVTKDVQIKESAQIERAK